VFSQLLFSISVAGRKEDVRTESVRVLSPQAPRIRNETGGKESAERGQGAKFLEMSDIQGIDRSNLVYIRSHFDELDKKIIGFMKGELSIWTGNSSSGKSTVLGQLSLTAVNDGFNVLMYSGELTPSRVKNWLHLQAAGEAVHDGYRV